MERVLKNMGNGLVFALVLVICAAAAWGWGWNIVKLAHMGADQLGFLLIRVAGVFIPPLGAIVGFV